MENLNINKYINRVIKHIDKFPISDRYDIERIYGIGKEEYLQLINYEKSLLDKSLLGNVYNILDIPNTIYTGTYDFQFEITEIQIIDMDTNKSGGYGGLDSGWFVDDMKKSNFILDIPIRVYIDILPGGTVDIDGETKDVNQHLINDGNYGWEVEMEIKDTFYEFLKRKVPFIYKSCGYQLFEVYPIYPEIN